MVDRELNPLCDLDFHDSNPIFSYMTHDQGCRLPHTCTPVACWNDVGHIQLTGSWVVYSYFAKAQSCRPDFTHRNQTQVNTSDLLLSCFVCFHVRVKVNSLAFAIENFCPYSRNFVLHVAAAVWLKQQSASTKKAMRRKKESKSGIWKRENKQKMARLPEVSSQWWRAFVVH